MDEILYNSFNNYFHALEMKGYMSYPQMQKLLLLSFYRDFVFHDYRGILSREDYQTIERALDCLYGSTCLIPYPDYLKMGKLHIGETTELAHRVKEIEESEVLKLIHNLGSITGDPQSDVIITESSDNKDLMDDSALIRHNIQRLNDHDERLSNVDEQLGNHDHRIAEVEGTKVIKGNNHIQVIPDLDLSAYDKIPDA